MRRRLAAIGAGIVTAALSAAFASAGGPPLTGINAENYRVNYFACSAFSLKSLARQFHVAANANDVASAAANGYVRSRRQAVVEGCLDALLKRPPKVKGAP